MTTTPDHAESTDDRAEAAPSAYPVDLECEVTTMVGTTVQIRPIRPDDADRLVEFHGGLSAHSVYFRFFSPHPRLSAAEIERFTHVDYADRLALVVTVEGALVAVGRYDRVSGAEAEVAFVVADAWQHHGIATLLLELLARAAWVCGIDTFVASTLPDNKEMLGVFTHSRFDVSTRLEGGLVSVRFGIGPARQREQPPTGR